VITTSVVLALVLAVLAALHAYWGAGGVWPGVDEANCARTVTGFRGRRRMPPPASAFAVAGLLAIAALVALGLGIAAIPPQASSLLWLAGAGVALVFLGRGLLGFTPAWRRLTPEQPFARLDRRFYSPLCLAIGLGYAFLVFNGTPQ
jgi:hypothetical protein